MHWNDVKLRQKAEGTIKVFVRFCENENWLLGDTDFVIFARIHETEIIVVFALFFEMKLLKVQT